jgi:hypothetical protein
MLANNIPCACLCRVVVVEGGSMLLRLLWQPVHPPWSYTFQSFKIVLHPLGFRFCQVALNLDLVIFVLVLTEEVALRVAADEGVCVCV